jgi:Mrp family chromosome partitioning ATPase
VTKRTGRYGEIPGATAEGQPRPPLPLLTQPMAPLDDAGATRADLPPPAAPVGQRHESAAVLFNKATVIQPAQSKAISPAGAAPEIGLTQHHLPEGETLDPRLVLVSDPDSERAASFRVLRHHLLELGRPQVIVVSSARHGDGKTTTAINLALALAECGRAKVLLAEAHLRRPQIGSAVKLIPPWCFAEQLAAHRNQPMLPWSLVEIPQLWLHVAAVNPRIEKTQLLDAPAFAIAMERLRMVYDHIVIDAPPVLGSADVNLMSDAADAVVLAVRAKRTTTREVRKAIDQVGASKVVGTVLCM